VIATLLGADRRLPRAIVCANDQTAIGVMHALAQHGIRVPAEVAVTGFDDVAVARHLHPTLTTVRQPIREMGVIAFDLLHAAITATAVAQRDVVLPVELVIRESCGCNRSGQA
jgi:LacI family transcriptional regulator